MTGSIGETCNEQTGQCECSSNYAGLHCDECKNGYYGYPACICKYYYLRWIYSRAT